MKRIIFIIAIAFCFCLNTQAQVFIGGKFSNSTEHSLKYHLFSFCVGYQYNKLAWGLDYAFQNANRLYNGVYTIKREYAFDFSPFFRYHFYNNGKMSLFLLSEFTYTIHKNEKYHAIFCSPGIQYQLSKHCAVTANVGFIGYSDSYWYGFKDFGCSFELGSSSLSFYYVF